MKLYNIFDPPGKLYIFAAKLTQERSIWVVKSARGQVDPRWTIVEVAEGAIIEHWNYGRVQVVRINRKSITLLKLESGIKIRHSL